MIFLCLILLLVLLFFILNRRPDDNPQVIGKRFDIYYENINDIKNYYSDILVEVNNINLDKTIDTIMKLIKIPKIIIIGPPFSGKSTVAKIISQKLNLNYISVGEEIRNEIKNNTQLGSILQNYYNQGALIPTDIIKQILLKKKFNNSWIMDGTPRNIRDIELLEQIGIYPNIVILLKVDEKNMQKRIQNFRENFDNFNEVTNEKLVNCQGCIDENAECRQGTVPQCKNIPGNLCYAFYDENGNQRTPCGIFDRREDAEDSCTGCQQYCQWCIDKNGDGTCISREIFDCDLCPNSRICQENPFNIFIKKED